MDIFRVTAFFDQEGNCWVAEGDNVPGLATEEDSLDQLIATLNIMIPEMLDANHGPVSGSIIEYEHVVKHQTSIAILDS